MITKISLVNICYHTDIENFFPVMRTCMVYSLSKFKMCNTVLLNVQVNLRTDELFAQVLPVVVTAIKPASLQQVWGKQGHCLHRGGLLWRKMPWVKDIHNYRDKERTLKFWAPLCARSCELAFLSFLSRDSKDQSSTHILPEGSVFFRNKDFCGNLIPVSQLSSKCWATQTNQLFAHSLHFPLHLRGRC